MGPQNELDIICFECYRFNECNIIKVRDKCSIIRDNIKPIAEIGKNYTLCGNAQKGGLKMGIYYLRCCKCGKLSNPNKEERYCDLCGGYLENGTYFKEDYKPFSCEIEF